MARTRTTDEVRDGYIQAMGPELGPLFNEAAFELMHIHWRWKQYRILFSVSQVRIELLNQSAPSFFRILKQLLFEETLLAIARLVEPYRPGPRQNLTIHGFPAVARAAQIEIQLRGAINEAERATKFARDWRHRRLAHRDLKLLLKQRTNPLAPASQQAIEDSLEALRNVLNCIETHYCKSETEYREVLDVWDAEPLLYVLRDGLRAQERRRKRRERGEFTAEDLKDQEPMD